MLGTLIVFDRQRSFSKIIRGQGLPDSPSRPIQIDYTSTFLAVPSVDGFDFGGSSGTGFGTIIFNGN